jgi:DNA-binding transcriptional MerR regulator
MVVKIEDRIEMKELLRKSGINSSTFHNWVNRGLLPRSCASQSFGGRGSEYFYPAWAAERAADIKRLRDQGFSMQLIRKILAGEKVGL